MIYDDHVRDVVKTAFLYDPGTGTLEWVDRGSRRRRDLRAGYIRKDGYIDVELTIDGRRVRTKAHIVGWLLYYGEWPAGVIDHINGCRSDNRICNLRDVSHGVNSENRAIASASNASGLLGVVTLPDGMGYRALISTEGVEIHLGVFNTPKEAHAAYRGAKCVLHRGFVPSRYEA